MLALVITSLLSLPIYPLNPIQHDTVATVNLHGTIGLNSPNRMGNMSPELGIKAELLVTHPFIVRTSCEYKLLNMNSKFYPDGFLHGVTVAAELMYYRGTSTLMGFIGGGPIAQFNHLSISDRAADSIFTDRGVTSVSVRPTLGYRITFGLRYKRIYSLEVSVSETQPKFLYMSRLSPTEFAESSQRAEISDVRIALGYLWTLRGM